ncbi:ImmA/IrrE family metallo-endopeptidase (plasmid) [Xylanimonas allomyrinae]|uniref:ImmA/IrrE family metallo-endopeptidase n=1 Tax=Xylanimonas allomyrinae TaxID=2509459 RepID=A0A4P6ER40_9MICO|nr:ArdC-like ssDNA-binding domain-containing protein [Xylanimonas allomyrinae]QAY64985.1 ImmA/IrrE family metallo-endopeptidase [Xylanimonas allomyrinae]
MARKIKTTKSPEERRAEAEALHATITEQVEALCESAAWTRFLEFARSFHHYSLNNLLLILAQKPEATQVAGYRTWQKLGRQVRKGERGIRIFGGRDVVTTAKDEETGEESETRRSRFFPVSVFDKSQTDAVAGVDDPGTIAHRLTGDDPAGILAAVVDYLTAEGWTVERAPIKGETNGYTTTDGTRRVVIDADLSPAQAAKTALHEAAHVILHAEQTAAEYVAHRGTKEAEAEATAYVVAGILNMDTSAYSVGYVAGWTGGDVETIKDTARNVLRAAHTLADAITEPETDDEAAAA